MAKQCVFCGRELGFFDRDVLTCGDVEQPTCSQCYLWAIYLPMEERCEKALETGRALEPERIRAYLTTQADELARARAKREEEARKLRTDKTCLRCGGPMLKYGRKLIQLGSTVGLFQQKVTRDGWLSEWMELDVLRCANCNRAEFFIVDDDQIPARPAPPRPAQTAKAETPARAKEDKPPWEK